MDTKEVLMNLVLCNGFVHDWDIDYKLLGYSTPETCKESTQTVMYMIVLCGMTANTIGDFYEM